MLEKLREKIDFYFIVSSDLAKEVELLHAINIPSRVFQYSTEVGSIALIRQLSAVAHIETSASHFNALKRFLPRIICLNDSTDAQQSASETLNQEQYNHKHYNSCEQVI